MSGIVIIVCGCGFLNRDRVISYALGRRLPTDHVSGLLQFRFEITSSINPGLHYFLYQFFFMYETLYYVENLFRDRFLTFSNKVF